MGKEQNLPGSPVGEKLGDWLKKNGKKIAAAIIIIIVGGPRRPRKF